MISIGTIIVQSPGRFRLIANSLVLWMRAGLLWDCRVARLTLNLEVCLTG